MNRSPFKALTPSFERSSSHRISQIDRAERKAAGSGWSGEHHGSEPAPQALLAIQCLAPPERVVALPPCLPQPLHGSAMDRCLHFTSGIHQLRKASGEGKAQALPAPGPACSQASSLVYLCPVLRWVRGHPNTPQSHP